MKANRIWQIDGERYDPMGPIAGDEIRGTALLAIEEVMGGSPARPVAEPVGAVPAARLDLPRHVPAAASATRPARAKGQRPTRRRRGRLGIVALTLGLALVVGAVLGSGAFNSEDRFNTRLYEAQVGASPAYEVPEVHGHSGARPAGDRSDSLREFLGFAQAF